MSVSALPVEPFDIRTQNFAEVSYPQLTATQGKLLLEGLFVRNTDKEGTTREGRQRSGVFIIRGCKINQFPGNID